MGRNEASAKAQGDLRWGVGMSPIWRRAHFWALLFLAAHNSRILDVSLSGNGGGGSWQVE
jgi:hypothetical protein